MKIWIGNLDGRRQGLVIASSKKRACEVIGTHLTDFNRFWTVQPSVEKVVEALAIRQELKPETLYTRPIDAKLVGGTWQEGRCPL